MTTDAAPTGEQHSGEQVSLTVAERADLYRAWLPSTSGGYDDLMGTVERIVAERVAATLNEAADWLDSDDRIVAGVFSVRQAARELRRFQRRCPTCKWAAGHNPKSVACAFRAEAPQ